MRDSGWSGDRRPGTGSCSSLFPLIVTMAVGLIVGIRLVSEKNATLRLSNNGQGTANCHTSLARHLAPAASPSMTPSPTAAATVTPPPRDRDGDEHELRAHAWQHRAASARGPSRGWDARQERSGPGLP